MSTGTGTQISIPTGTQISIYKLCKSCVYQDCWDIRCFECPVHTDKYEYTRISGCYCVRFHEGQTNDTQCRYYKPKEDTDLL